MYDDRLQATSPAGDDWFSFDDSSPAGARTRSGPSVSATEPDVTLAEPYEFGRAAEVLIALTLTALLVGWFRAGGAPSEAMSGSPGSVGILAATAIAAAAAVLLAILQLLQDGGPRNVRHVGVVVAAVLMLGISVFGLTIGA